MPTQNLFDQFLVYMNSHQHVKNSGYFTDLFWKYKWLIKKSSNLIGWEHFGAYLRNKNFAKYGICKGTKQTNFHYSTNSIKMNDLIFQLKSPIFGPLSQFWGKNFFWKIPPSCKTSHGFLSPCQNLKKTSNIIPKKCLHRRKDGRKDRQTTFYRTLPATAAVQKY